MSWFCGEEILRFAQDDEGATCGLVEWCDRWSDATGGTGETILLALTVVILSEAKDLASSTKAL